MVFLFISKTVVDAVCGQKSDLLRIRLVALWECALFFCFVEYFGRLFVHLVGEREILAFLVGYDVDGS